MMKRFFCMLCVGVMVLFGGVVMVGCGNEDVENYASGIVVTITQEALDSGKIYTVEDFSDISCTKLYYRTEPDEFLLSIGKFNKKAIYDAVDILNGRNDILCVEIKYFNTSI